MPARYLVEMMVARLVEATIRFGWVKGEHVVMAPFTDGEDNHHITHRRLLPDGDDTGWKRWRYNSSLETVFWWEAPTVAERDEVEMAISNKGNSVDKHVFVELNSSRPGSRFAATKIMPTHNLADLEDEGNDPGILDVTHYMDAPTDAARRWLRTVGD